MQTLTTCDLVFSSKVGSHLYGTNLPASDLDIKEVYFPSATSLLLGTTPPLLSSSATPKAHGVRNTSADTDVDYYSLQRFLHLLFSGQPDTIELVFSTAEAWVTTTPRGLELLELLKKERKRWVTKRIASRFRGFAGGVMGEEEWKS